jgi:hypothetical protein
LASSSLQDLLISLNKGKPSSVQNDLSRQLQAFFEASFNAVEYLLSIVNGEWCGYKCKVHQPALFIFWKVLVLETVAVCFSLQTVDEWHQKPLLN